MSQINMQNYLKQRCIKRAIKTTIKHKSNQIVVTFHHYLEETQLKKKLMQKIALKAKVILIWPKQVIFKCFYVTN